MMQRGMTSMEKEKVINEELENIRVPLNPNPENLPAIDFEKIPIDQWRRLSMAHRMCS